MVFDFSPSEEHGERVFENRLMQRTFGLNSEEVKGVWKELHNSGGFQRPAANYCSAQHSHRKRKAPFKNVKISWEEQ
jgi:hypothetical protein